MTVPHLPHKTDLKMWSAVDRNGCFVKLSRSINFVPPEGYKKLIEWGLPSHLLIFAPASAWSLLHITCLSPSSLSALLHMCRDAGYKKLIEWGLPSHLLIFAPASAWSLLHILHMPVSILFVCTATHVPWRTGRTKVALVELPTVNMVGFFFCTPFPRRILAWSFVVPRSHSHPPKALKSYIFKRGW